LDILKIPRWLARKMIIVIMNIVQRY